VIQFQSARDKRDPLAFKRGRGYDIAWITYAPGQDAHRHDLDQSLVAALTPLGILVDRIAAIQTARAEFLGQRSPEAVLPPMTILSSGDYSSFADRDDRRNTSLGGTCLEQHRRGQGLGRIRPVYEA